MNITTKWLEKRNACPDAVQWVDEQPNKDEFVLIKAAMEKNRFDWANWYLSRRLNIKNKVKYAVFAAQYVLSNYEKIHPNNNQPRRAIVAAKKYIRKQSFNNKKNAREAAYGAYAAAETAANAAEAAYGANAAYAAAYAAEAAAEAADAAADYDIKTKVVEYGISLIK